eukprot:4010568-Prymnesium_polylepis.1
MACVHRAGLVINDMNNDNLVVSFPANDTHMVDLHRSRLKLIDWDKAMPMGEKVPLFDPRKPGFFVRNSIAPATMVFRVPGRPLTPGPIDEPQAVETVAKLQQPDTASPADYGAGAAFGYGLFRAYEHEFGLAEGTAFGPQWPSDWLPAPRFREWNIVGGTALAVDHAVD